MMEKNDFNNVTLEVLNQKASKPYWVVLIQDLVDGAGYSYSRIAHRMGVSPSTIQKLATNHSRKPRHSVFHKLLVLYYKVFHGPYASPQAKAYLQLKEMLMKKPPSDS